MREALIIYLLILRGVTEAAALLKRREGQVGLREPRKGRESGATKQEREERSEPWGSRSTSSQAEPCKFNPPPPLAPSCCCRARLALFNPLLLFLLMSGIDNISCKGRSIGEGAGWEQGGWGGCDEREEKLRSGQRSGWVQAAAEVWMAACYSAWHMMLIKARKPRLELLGLGPVIHFLWRPRWEVYRKERLPAK